VLNIGNIVPSVANEAQQDRWFSPQSHNRSPKVVPQLRDRPTTDIAQFDPFQIPPDAFIGIGVRRVARQSFEVQPCGRTVRQKLFDGLTPMNADAIPNHGQRTGDLGQQMPQKAHDPGSIKRGFADPREQPPRVGDAADHRQMIPRQRHTQRWCHAAWSIGAYPAREQIKAGFIDPNDRPLFG
jgi:hypothetical protein